MKFEIKLDAFSGPLQLLLELVEKQDLPITEVALAKVTEDYLKHLEANEVPSSELADFLVVAARLLYLKSAAILPTPPAEEEDAGALAAQLKLYKEFVVATEYVDALYRAGRVSYGRPVNATKLPVVTAFRPPENATPSALQSLFATLLKRLEPFFTLQQTTMHKIVSVQERIKQIREVLLERAQMSFKDITKGAGSRIEVVVSFLALLELMKQKAIMAVQSSAFGDIELKRVD